MNLVVLVSISIHLNNTSFPLGLSDERVFRWFAASGVPVASFPGGLDHNFQRALRFIAEVRSLQDLRQQEDR